MKRYKLKRDLPTFKAGEIFYISDAGNLLRESDNIAAYSWTTLDKFPNIMTDWFDEIKESTRWKPDGNQKYYYLGNSGSVYCDTWANCSPIDNGRFEIGNCFQNEEEAEIVVEYLKALAIVRGDATTEFIKGRNNFYVVYDAAYNCLVVKDKAYYIGNGIFGLPYFVTKEDAQKSIELHRHEWLTIFGVKEEDEAQK